MASRTGYKIDIDEIKMQYYDMLTEAAVNKPVQLLQRREWINLMIQRILTAKDILSPKEGEYFSNWESKLPPILKDAIYNYDVVNQNSEQRLVRKAIHMQDTAKVVVPLEDSFEIVMQAHFETKHGGCSEINKYISNKNKVVAMICAPVLVSACQKCLLNDEEEVVVKVSIEERYQTLALVNIIDMTLQPDKSFSHLLLYQDLNTKFVQLRPLASKDLTEEIAMELVKVFSDFPQPVCLVTIEELEEVFENVLTRVNTVYYPSILLETCNADKYGVTFEVVDRIGEWIKNNTKEWSIGCHFVQWAMNKSRSYGGSPYEKFFGLERVNSIPYNVRTPVSSDPREEGKRRRTVHKLTDGKNNLADGKDTMADGKDTLADGKDNLADGKDNLADGKDNLADGKDNYVPDVIDVETDEEMNDSPHRISQANVSDALESTSIIIDNVKTLQENEMEIESELETEKETQIYTCCMCSEPVQTQVYFCSECKNSLHLYCGVRRKGVDGVVKNVCFLCLKP